ncbi:6-phosphogluconolactonase [Frateuria aurantia]|uniref:6-phosphogluconolactonase n=1 Tax=Frateuria aurantia (strain ATCC 33424 / DSM 6220 / KCTC 2777 / LMG 1558 / NBRC 3245 / NCIMB 13370) TaxID=767434 RepID=H8KZQ4_FRAAD|nr:6-phosphogluconolactonase [Frateuria aurantia]AFC84565.1 6-phosphogluconolactonase [Frateuria aurantia DSM 6220]
MSASAEISQHTFASSAALAEALAGELANRLRKAIAERGRALIAVSGGSTPKQLFDRLSQLALDWDKVYVTLVDERWVPESSDRSNARLVKAMLLKHAAAAAHFVPLYEAGQDTPEAGLVYLQARLSALPARFDAVVLGMGGDGHTASFFPGGDHLTQALDLQGRQRLWPMRAEGAGEPRITFSLPALLDTEALYLHIEGAAKREVFKQAETGEGAGAHYPVRAVLNQSRTPLSVFWSP